MKHNELFLLIKHNKTEEALNLIAKLKTCSIKKQYQVLNYTNHNNENCIMEAAFRGESLIVKALNNCPTVNLYKQNTLGNTALMLAIINEQMEVLKYILNITNLDYLLLTNNQRNNILHLALLTKNNNLVKIIFDHLKNYHHPTTFPLEKILLEHNEKNMTPFDLSLHLKLDILFELNKMVRPLFILKNQESKNLLI